MLILQTVMFLVLFILVVNVSIGRDALQSLLFSVALAVGLTPGFLPMITTVTLAQGARRMAREKVIVKHLPSIQNLGSIDILCSDKTGTLTAGTMTLDASLDPSGRPSARPLFLGHLNSRFESGIKSPLDVAILEREVPGAEGFTKTDEIPFDFDRRRLSIVVEKDGAFLLVTKGAPESVLSGCTSMDLDGRVQPLDAGAMERCLETFRGLSERGFRVIAVASKGVSSPLGFKASDERDLTLAGFLTFADHLLEGVEESITRLRSDGVAGEDPHRRQRARDPAHLQPGGHRQRPHRPRQRDRADGRGSARASCRARECLRARFARAEASHHPCPQVSRARRWLPRRRNQ